MASITLKEAEAVLVGEAKAHGVTVFAPDHWEWLVRSYLGKAANKWFDKEIMFAVEIIRLREELEAAREARTKAYARGYTAGEHNGKHFPRGEGG